jgi:hypothetical protein
MRPRLHAESARIIVVSKGKRTLVPAMFGGAALSNLYRPVLAAMHHSVEMGELNKYAGTGDPVVAVIALGEAHCVVHRVVAEWAFGLPPPVDATDDAALAAALALEEESAARPASGYGWSTHAEPAFTPKQSRKPIWRYPPGVSPLTTDIVFHTHEILASVPEETPSSAADSPFFTSSPSSEAEACSTPIPVPIVPTVTLPTSPLLVDEISSDVLPVIVHFLYKSGTFPADTPANMICATIVVVAESCHPGVAKELARLAMSALDERVIGKMSPAWAERLTSPEFPMPLPQGLELTFLKSRVSNEINHIRGWKCTGCHTRNKHELSTCHVRLLVSVISCILLRSPIRRVYAGLWESMPYIHAVGCHRGACPAASSAVSNAVRAGPRLLRNLCELAFRVVRAPPLDWVITTCLFSVWHSADGAGAVGGTDACSACCGRVCSGHLPTRIQ